MRQRIWEELTDTIYYSYYLTEYISSSRKKLERLELFALILTIGGIFGWFKTGSSYSMHWTIFLCLIQVGNFFRNRFMVPKQELVLLELTQKHYRRQWIDLENLWEDFHNEKINDKQAERKFRVIQTKEVEVLELYNHRHLKNISRINNVACKRRNEYLTRFKQ